MHLPIDYRPERLHQVVDQYHRVRAVRVHQAEAGMKPRSHHCAGNTGAKDSVAVIQQTVYAAAVLVAAKVLAEHQRPVAARGLGLNVVRIAGPHPAGQQIEPPAWRSNRGQGCALGENFCPNQLGPKPLLQRQAGGNLAVHATGLKMVPFDRPHDGCRHVVRATQDDGHAPRRQLDQRIVRVTDPVRIGDHRGNLVNCYTADFLTALGNHDKSAVHGQMTSVRGDFDDPTYHAQTLSLGLTRQTRPISSTRTRSARRRFKVLYLAITHRKGSSVSSCRRSRLPASLCGASLKRLADASRRWTTIISRRPSTSSASVSPLCTRITNRAPG